MENNISVNLENLSEKEREQLMKLIKKSNKPKSKILKPEYNEIYFFISEYGDVRNSINEYEIDWADKNQEKWCMYYSYMDGDVYFTDAYCHKRNDIYFSSKKIGAQAVNSIRKERLKKYYFEVED